MSREAERSRSNRYRRTNGIRCARPEYDAAALTTRLVEDGYLARADEDDRQAIDRAITQMLEHYGSQDYVLIRLDARLLQWLVDQGHLNWQATDDPAAIRAALGALASPTRVTASGDENG